MTIIDPESPLDMMPWPIKWWRWLVLFLVLFIGGVAFGSPILQALILSAGMTGWLLFYKLLVSYTLRAYPNCRSTWRSWAMATLAAFGFFAAVALVSWLILKFLGAV